MFAWSLEAPGMFVKTDVRQPAAAEVGPGEVLLRVLVGGICGSDLPYFAGGMHAVMVDEASGAARIPGYPMHELVAEVVTSRDPYMREGARVAGWAGHCNALAEYVVTAGRDVHMVDEDLSSLDAITVQPLACVLGAMNDLGDVSGARVAVLGQGPIGLLFSHVAKTRGADVVEGVDRVDRADCVADFRLDRFVHSSIDRWAARAPRDEAPDVIIETVGHQVGTLTHAVEAAAVDGRIYYFGIPDDTVYPLPMKALLRKRLTLQAGWVLPEQRRRLLEEAHGYLREAPEVAKAFVTNVYGFEEVPQAFLAASLPKPGQRKIAVQFTV
jgi:L-iditol 2-dehydrogenase